MQLYVEKSLESLTNILFLLDWTASINQKGPITEIEWFLSEGYPIAISSSFDQVFGHWLKQHDRLRTLFLSLFSTLSESDKEIIDSEMRKLVHFNSFFLNNLVLHTYPCQTYPNVTMFIDLKKLAEEYHAIK